MTETPVAARPKGMQPVTLRDHAEQTERLHSDLLNEAAQQEPKRGPGRPPKSDPFTVLTMIASALKTVDKPVRKQILDTLQALSD